MNKIFKACCGLILIVLSAASYGQAWVTVPSGVGLGEEVDVTAGGFSPDETVSVTITYPDGNNHTEAKVANANGEVTLVLIADVAGEYNIDATSQANPENAAFPVILVVIE
ncbi:hypothetical protein ACMXYQ_08525 [Neptuniibacter sp. PT34_22]|uniref:hypothetical protein n=1 Tax=Neptuniibacter sp. PT34_22 TaxID=3398205 RepID=UPI0039F5C174